MNKLLNTLAIFSLVCCLYGCASCEIIVQDENGQPISGATIYGTSLTISGQNSISNDRGCASIPFSIQKIVWISVVKSGFERVEGIDVNQDKPIKVILKRID